MMKRVKQSRGNLVNMQIKSTDIFDKKYEDVCLRNPKIGSLADKKIAILLENPRHPSLRLHKVIRLGPGAWSVSINMKLRLIFVYRDYGILLIDIGDHDEVY